MLAQDWGGRRIRAWWNQINNLGESNRFIHLLIWRMMEQPFSGLSPKSPKEASLHVCTHFFPAYQPYNDVACLLHPCFLFLVALHSYRYSLAVWTVLILIFLITTIRNCSYSLAPRREMVKVDKTLPSSYKRRWRTLHLKHGTCLWTQISW
jgi:hypothetical protein